MDRFRGHIVTRLLAGIALGTLFLAGGFYCVGKFLTPDLMIRQQLVFRIPEPCQEQFSTQWAAFAQEQKVQLLQLAEHTLPLLVRYVSVIAQTEGPIVTLRLRCPPDTDDAVHKKFNELVAAYTAQRNAIEQSEVISASNVVFHARLDLSELRLDKTYPKSRFQQFVLVVFALVGFFLGIGPPGGYLRTPKEELAKSPQESHPFITTAPSEPKPIASPIEGKKPVEQAEIAAEEAKPESEPEPEIEFPSLWGHEEEHQENLGTIQPAQPEQEGRFEETPAAIMNDEEEEMEHHSRQQEILLSEVNIEEEVSSEPDPFHEPTHSESEEFILELEQQSVPVVAIDLNKDMPTAQAAGMTGAARSKYDTLADLIETLRPQVRCPVIAISALNPKDVSPRLTVNLAVTLIRRALRVLIVEADPSSKELATLFGLPDEPGFFEWRRGAAWISHTTSNTQLVGLSVMPAGIPNEPQKQPDLELWRETHRWGNLANDFDVVLLYSPSALAEDPQTPEQVMGVHLRTMVHGFLALTRSTKQLETHTQTVVDNLADHTAPLLAMVPVKP